MKQGLTLLVVILDRSGSMSSMQREMEDALRRLFADQQKGPGECITTFAMFDDNSANEPKVQWVCEMRPVGEVPTWALVPRGMTPLLDAVGIVVTKVGERLHALSESERPEKVALCIITDGYENASHDWTKETVSKLLKQQQDQYNWGVTFLGANIDAWGQAAAVGIPAASSASYTPSTANAAVQDYSNKLFAARSAPDSASYKSSFEYSEEERKRLGGMNQGKTPDPK